MKAVADTADADPPPPHDVYAPCALGGALDERDRGGAAGTDRLRRRRTTSSPPRASPSSCVERGILYAPDYLVNAGGVIQVADERAGLRRSTGPRPRPRGIFDDRPADLRGRGRRGRVPRRRRRPAGRAADGRRSAGSATDPAAALTEEPSRRRPPLGRSTERRPAHATRGRDVCPRRSVYRKVVRDMSLSRGRHAGLPARGLDSRTPCEGVEPMGRGRAKAKQTSVARELKYSSPNTDLTALQRELPVHRRRTPRPHGRPTTMTRTTSTPTAGRTTTRTTTGPPALVDRGVLNRRARDRHAVPQGRCGVVGAALRSQR